MFLFAFKVQNALFSPGNKCQQANTDNILLMN